MFPDKEPKKKRVKNSPKHGGEGWLVVLHNDNVNCFDDAVIWLMQAAGMPPDQAHEVVQTAHEHGQAYVTPTTRGNAFRIQQALNANGIRCTVHAR